ncbi:MAG: peptidase [Chryseobacterium sp.]|jgi:C-terminal processing protease CtpA/Prc|nr:peptidase [Chryseobacterium sp.]
MNITLIKNLYGNQFKFLLLSFFAFISIVSCRQDDEGIPDFPEGSTESVNLWVQDSMRRYYYWAEHMPSKPNYSLPTQDFFKSLLSPQDRFSFILDTKDASTYPKSVRSRYGFDYTILQQPDGKIVTVIKLVLQNSPAQNAGLKRGMVITKINGTVITSANMGTVSSSIINSTVLHLSVGDWNNGNITNEKDITVYYGFTLDQSLVSKIFEHNGKKTAYLYIYDFPDGMAQLLLQKFSEFKALGVQALVLDLRYNYGGSVASAATLCAMIPAGISSNSPFIIYRGNKNGGEVKMNFSQQIAYDKSAPGFNILHANTLGLNKVYILTSESTASASEIVINNLKPYLEVIQVGGTTLGKDMAGFAIEDKHNPPKISWQIHPVIYKVYNANSEGEYSNGISPQISVNEFSFLPLLPLGDPNETLLSSALNKIYSKTSGNEMPDHSLKILWESDWQHGINMKK